MERLTKVFAQAARGNRPSLRLAVDNQHSGMHLARPYYHSHAGNAQTLNHKSFLAGGRPATRDLHFTAENSESAITGIAAYQLTDLAARGVWLVVMWDITVALEEQRIALELVNIPYGWQSRKAADLLGETGVGSECLAQDVATDMLDSLLVCTLAQGLGTNNLLDGLQCAAETRQLQGFQTASQPLHRYYRLDSGLNFVAQAALVHKNDLFLRIVLTEQCLQDCDSLFSGPVPFSWLDNQQDLIIAQQKIQLATQAKSLLRPTVASSQCSSSRATLTGSKGLGRGLAQHARWAVRHVSSTIASKSTRIDVEESVELVMPRSWALYESGHCTNESAIPSAMLQSAELSSLEYSACEALVAPQHAQLYSTPLEQANDMANRLPMANMETHHHCSMVLAVRNAHSGLRLIQPKHRYLRSVCTPEPAEQLGPGDTAEMLVLPESGVRSRGYLVYRMVSTEGTTSHDTPHVCLTIGYELSSGRLKRAFVDVVHVDSIRIAKGEPQYQELFKLLGKEVRRGADGHPNWQGHLEVGTAGLLIGCALATHLVEDRLNRLEVALVHLPPPSTAPKSILPPLWLSVGGPRYATDAGIRTRRQLIQWVAEINVQAKMLAKSGQASVPAMSSVFVMENQHSKWLLKLHAQSSSITRSLSAVDSLASSTSIVPYSADGFASMRSKGGSLSYNHVVYHLARKPSKKAGPPNNMRYSGSEEKCSHYMVVAWSSSKAGKSGYALEFLHAEPSLEATSWSFHCTVLMLMALGRTERGHRICRNGLNCVYSKQKQRQRSWDVSTSDPEKAIAICAVAHMDFGKTPALFVSLRNTAPPSMHTLSLPDYPKEHCMPRLSIRMENNHPHVLLDDYRSYLVGCELFEPASHHSYIDSLLERGSVRTLCFAPTSTRQLGVITFNVKSRSALDGRCCLVVAWRLSPRSGHDVTFYACMVTKNDAKSVEAAARLPPNLYSAVYGKQDQSYTNQENGLLADGTVYTIQVNLHHRAADGALEAAVSLTGDLMSRAAYATGISRNVANRAYAESQSTAGESILCCVQNLHRNMALRDIQMCALRGKTVQEPSQSYMPPGRAVLVRMCAMRARSNDYSQGVSGMLVARLECVEKADKDCCMFLLAGWDTSNERRIFSADVIRINDSEVRRHLRNGAELPSFFQRYVVPRLRGSIGNNIQRRYTFSALPGLYMSALIESHIASNSWRLEVTLRRVDEPAPGILSASPMLTGPRDLRRAEDQWPLTTLLARNASSGSAASVQEVAAVASSDSDAFTSSSSLLWESSWCTSSSHNSTSMQGCDTDASSLEASERQKDAAYSARPATDSPTASVPVLHTYGMAPGASAGMVQESASLVIELEGTLPCASLTYLGMHQASGALPTAYSTSPALATLRVTGPVRWEIPAATPGALPRLSANTGEEHTRLDITLLYALTIHRSSRSEPLLPSTLLLLRIAADKEDEEYHRCALGIAAQHNNTVGGTESSIAREAQQLYSAVRCRPVSGEARRAITIAPTYTLGVRSIFSHSVTSRLRIILRMES
ncbi:hypothetical protein THASP1DRAFT_28995 [Thamnocephalis sphaerospora]|uniref:Uncharacterized protein n=1 Tax=Thamnocephalis sphaerospora TaxID=78915 RepID=A0A4P9XSV7_9FUNG|nr:hypothetical protein THASP1DRAFT_28995 [Thamnocephalis sphaerospora]|eukprot:RKP09223.1 hypothetical protein THASP1DRAFT_28995 [Thamnocephalis sphaerospora]